MSRVLPKISGKNRAKQRFFALLPCAAAGGGVCEYHQAFFRPPDGSSYSAYITIYRNTARSPARPGRQGASMQKKYFFITRPRKPRKDTRLRVLPAPAKRRTLALVRQAQDAPSPNILYGFWVVCTGYCAFYTIFGAKLFRSGSIFLLLIFVEFVIIKL